MLCVFVCLLLTTALLHQAEEEEKTSVFRDRRQILSGSLEEVQVGEECALLCHAKAKVQIQ